MSYCDPKFIGIQFFIKFFIYQILQSELLGLFKKLKETAGKSIEKGIELGTKGYDSAMDAAKKGIDKAREERVIREQSSQTGPIPDPLLKNSEKTNDEKIESPKEIKSKTIDTEEIAILKMRLVKGEITKDQFEEMKKMLE